MKSREKTLLRSRVRQSLRNLSIEIQELKSKQIRSLIEHSDYLGADKPTLVFAPLPGEPNLLPLLEEHKSDQIFCFPRVIGFQLEIRRVSSLVDLLPGYAGILEPSPDACPLFPIQELKGILLPGLAFDPSNGGRLGKGKGFYDRLINEIRFRSNPSPITIGVCFSCQLNHVPLQKHDQNVDALVTEKGIILTSGS